MFLHLSVILLGGVSLSRGVSLQGGLCPGVSVQGVFVQGGLCPGVFLSRGVSVWGVSVQGVSVRETLHRTVTCGWYTSYRNASSLLLPMKLWEGNVFTGVCLSMGRGGSLVPGPFQGVSMSKVGEGLGCPGGWVPSPSWSPMLRYIRGRGVGMSRGGRYSPGPPPIWDTTGYGRQAGGTHPTAMLSCLTYNFGPSFGRKNFVICEHSSKNDVTTLMLHHMLVSDVTDWLPNYFAPSKQASNKNHSEIISSTIDF